MSIYKIELKTITGMLHPNETVQRYPSVDSLMMFLIAYKSNGQGIIILHDSFYDYKYDTKLNHYHDVDSKRVVGHLQDVERGKDDTIYLVVEINDDFDPDDNYLCFYRATMESNPRSDTRELLITNVFAIDLIRILDSELENIKNLSTFERYDEYLEKRRM